MDTKGALVKVPQNSRVALDSLLHLSAEIGVNNLLCQASSGNTSVKIDDTLWIKASGKWLAFAARNEILVPVDLAAARDCLKKAKPLEAAVHYLAAGTSLRPSIETLMHAALPHRAIAHVHSINAIAWAIRVDAPAQLAVRLAGLRWQWIPYVPSGLPLARSVAAHPDKDVFVLGNHGLVVCGETCTDIDMLLRDVEHRLAIPPRAAPDPALSALENVRRAIDWHIPTSRRIHSIATDTASRWIAKNGILFPCQAIFLGRHFPELPSFQPPSRQLLESFTGSPFLVVEGRGILLNPKISNAEYAILEGFAELLARARPAEPIRYLTPPEVESVISADSVQYRSSPDNRPNRF